MSDGTPAGGDWKNAAHKKPGQSPGPSRARGASRRPWQPGTATPRTPGVKRRSRTGRVLLVGGILGGLAALIVLVIIWLRPPRYPSLVVVGMTPPETALSLAAPENVAGANEAAALAEWAADHQQGKSRPDLAVPAANTWNRDAWKAQLDKRNKSTVLYFTAPGGADKDGPFLWFVPPDVRVPGDAHKLRVSEILARLAQVDPEKHKLVVFDAARFQASWVHGTLFNDFARALKEMDAEIEKVPNLVVICSCGENQQSWVSEEWRVSVFGHFFLEGLRGAAGKPGDRVTAADLFGYVMREVPRWAIANRDENQIPMLLPSESGETRARAVELAGIPSDGYPGSPKPDEPKSMEPDLLAAWEIAWQLADQGRRGLPSPDTLEPAKWRAYLELLGRWERMTRLGADTSRVKARAEEFGRQLKNAHGIGEPKCLSVAVPVGRALGLSPVVVSDDAFRNVWSPREKRDRAKEWANQLAQHPQQETAYRVAMAERVIARLLVETDSQPFPEKLRIAAEVLREVEGQAATAEGHFIRMLALHLDSERRPEPPLIRQAIALRRKAEEVAWVGGIGADRYAYPEQVFRWIRGHVEAGDRARRLGEDLLFDVKQESWDKAKNDYFKQANEAYDRARIDAEKVAAALRARDTVLARLPYYARWIAADRVARPGGELEKRLSRVEAAARLAHQIAKLARQIPDDPQARDSFLANRETEGTPIERLNAWRRALLADQPSDPRGAFDEVEQAFRDEIKELTGQNKEQPDHWHRLDNALTVPFIAAEDRAKLYLYVRRVSYALAIKSEQPSTTPTRPVGDLDMARRQWRMALAVLGDAPPTQKELDQPLREYREIGDLIGKRFQGIEALARQEADRAASVPEYRKRASNLDQAADYARTADPAAALDPALEAPTTADRRYWRHYLLLWQARRAVDDGWARADSTAAVPFWYCLEARNLLIDTAVGFAKGTEANPDPAELARRLADTEAARQLQPPTLDLQGVPNVQAVCDERTWGYTFKLARKDQQDARVGFPVWWVDPTGVSHTKLGAGLTGRHLEGQLAQGPESKHLVQLDNLPRKDLDVPSGTLRTKALYRGQLYEKPTTVRLAGAPTRDLYYNPPTGDAAFVVIAGRESVAGAVTILIDLSGSMLVARRGETKTKLEETFDAIDDLLGKDLPPGTVLTVATFWGGNMGRGDWHVEPAPGLRQIEWAGNDVQRKRVMELVRAIPTRGTEASTPLAWSVRKIIADKEAMFWPKMSTGTRTLLVLTDGMDNWEKKPGEVVLDALLHAEEDTALHILFFALPEVNSEGVREADEAARQFEPLVQKNAFVDTDRSPARVYHSLRDARGLADQLKQAMLPRVSYQLEVTDGRKRQPGRLVVTLPEEQVYKVSPRVPRGVYALRGLRNPQQLQLGPGDRVILRGERIGNKFDLLIPPTAYELARKLGRPIDGDRAGGAGVYLTLPDVRLHDHTGSCELDMVATMEPRGADRPGEYLMVNRPMIPWFEVEYADGKGPAVGRQPMMVVRNRPGLVAPAWDIRVSEWDAARGVDATRRPKVTSYWVEGKPTPAGELVVNLADPKLTPAVKWDVAEVVGQVELESVNQGADGVTIPGLAPGKYLTVRLRYTDPNRLVYLFPGALKETDQRYTLHERHAYYEPLQRYTARFGPLTPEELKKTVTLQLFAVPDLKTHATNTGRSATIVYPAQRRLDTDTLPDRLRLIPADK